MSTRESNPRADLLADLFSRELSETDVQRIAEATVELMRSKIRIDDIPELIRPMRQSEAAAFLGIDPATLSLMTSAGDVPCFRVSERRPVYLKADLVEWLRSRPYVTDEAA